MSFLVDNILTVASFEEALFTYAIKTLLNDTPADVCSIILTKASAHSYKIIILIIIIVRI